MAHEKCLKGFYRLGLDPCLDSQRSQNKLRQPCLVAELRQWHKDAWQGEPVCGLDR